VRTDQINSSLEVSISRARLHKYLENQGHDLDLAIGLYERNMRLSAAFYPELQALEVCLRNKLHDQMRTTYGAAWLRGSGTPLEASATAAIEDAWNELSKPDSEKTSGDIIAELKFSFWVGMLATKYDETLWRQACHKAFPNFKGRRSVVHGRLNAIRRFRNRVAHHEPIFHKDLQRIHSEVIEAIGWMCRDTQKWSASLSSVGHLLK